ncbi:MAG: HNH endonuclease [Pseudobutyrivibrio ruminis]|nr:HNH endonuclease [Pseudobutyrivibrio ruminis]
MIEYARFFNIDVPLPYVFGDTLGLKREVTFNDEWTKLIKDNTVTILGWIQFEKVKWLQNNNPEVPSLVYKLAPMDEKMRKLSHVRDLWKLILDQQTIMDVFKETPIEKGRYDIDHFIPWSFVMNDELWNLMPMDSSLNSSKSNKLPDWNRFFGKYADNQFILYSMINDEEKPYIRSSFEKCYKDNLHSIWANQELYRRGNNREEFYNILEKNMRPVYDSARRQGYVMW